MKISISRAMSISGGNGPILDPNRNKLTKTEDFTATVWNDASPNLPTVTANAITAPDGTLTADLLTAATGGTSSMKRQNVSSIANTVHYMSIFLQAGTSTQTRLLLRNVTGGVNIADATITWTAGVPSISITAAGTFVVMSPSSGWYRAYGFAATGATATPTLSMSIFPDTSLGTGSVYAWGAQLERYSLTPYRRVA